MVEKATRQEFEDFVEWSNEEMHTTITERVPLETVSGFMREIDVCENERLFYLRIGKSAIPVPFDKIHSIETYSEKDYAGTETVAETGNKWALTGAAAAAGWFAISRETKYKQVDKYTDFWFLKIKFHDHTEASKTLYPCGFSKVVAIKTYTAFKDLLDKYKIKYDKSLTGSNYITWVSIILFAFALILLIYANFSK